MDMIQQGHISEVTDYRFTTKRERGTDMHGLCTCSGHTEVLPCGECTVCHNLKGHNLVFIEMSTDGEHWQPIKLPPNSVPYHQVVHFGSYHEGVTEYRLMTREAQDAYRRAKIQS